MKRQPLRFFVELSSTTRALNIGRQAFRALEERFPGVSFEYLRSPEEFARRIAEPHFVACWRFPARLYARAANLRAVFTPAAGKEWVDEDPAGRVRVFRGSFHGKMIAESMLAMMLFFNDRRQLLLRNQHKRVWDRDAQVPRTRLANQRVLFVGYGAIGRHCARLLKAVGCAMVGLQRRHRSGMDRATGVRYCTVAHLRGELAQADHVVVLLPGGDETRHFLGREHFEVMKPSAHIYNFGRGTTIDEAALTEALRAKCIAGAGLDVFEQEPLPKDSPLWVLDNVLITPHTSCAFTEYGALFAEEMGQRLARLLR